MANLASLEHYDFNLTEAIEGAAEAGNPEQGGSCWKGRNSAVTEERVAAAREILRRFFELAPDDLSVRDLREMMEEQR